MTGGALQFPVSPPAAAQLLQISGMPVLSPVPSPDMAMPADTAMDQERFSGSVNATACSDESSGPVPTISADAVPNLTVVPVANLNSMSLAAAAVVADKQQQQQQQNGRHSMPLHQPQHQLEAVRHRRRLLFTQAPADCTEETIRAWLSWFGSVEQLQLYGEGGAVLGSNCGLVTMGTSEAAAAVVAAVLGNMQLPVPLQKLSVNWVVQSDEHGVLSADGNAMPSSLAANADRTIFFAKVPPTALASEVESLFGSFGKLAEVNLFRAWAGAKHSKGCGLVTYKDRSSAAAAIQQLHGEYVFPGSDCPMVVEWVDLKKQRPAAIVPAVDKPPMGCACDAQKLLLGNIPASVSESLLISTLSQFGPVVQLGLTADAAGPCASGYVWYATKQAADALINRSKADPVWLRDPRTGHDLALSVKKTRRPGMSNGTSSTTSRINVGLGYHTGPHLSSTSSSSSYLPFLQSQLANAQAAAVAAQDMHSNSARLAAAAAGMAGNSGSLDTLSMLQNANVMRLLPMHQSLPALLGQGPHATAALLQGSVVNSNGFMAHDVCEAMLDYMDNAGLNMGMPVHLQPAVAAQMASRLVASIPGLQPRPSMANSQVCCLPGGMVNNNSGQHCMSSPANLQGLDEFEGSFNMPALRGNSGQLLPGNRMAAGLANGLPATQQLMAQQQQLQQQAQLQQQQAQLQQQQLQQQQAQLQQQQLQQQQQQQQAVPAAAAGGYKSIAIPISGYEVQLVAEHLSFFAAQSGAQVSIACLPGTGLAVMITGQQDQIALAQSLLSTARGQC